MYIMIIQPMNGLTEKEITENRVRAINKIPKSYQVLNTFFEMNENNPLYYLSKSLEVMSQCDAVFCAKGWEKARGCKIEHEVAKQYGLNIMYEE